MIIKNLKLIVSMAMIIVFFGFKADSTPPIYDNLKPILSQSELQPAGAFRLAMTETVYDTQSCVDEVGCCGTQCTLGIVKVCCSATSCLCITDQADRDAIATALGWQTLDPVLWLNASYEQIHDEDVQEILGTYVDLSCAE